MKVIHIESGLGNQMLSYCEYLAMKKSNPEDDCYIETIIYDIPECNEHICQWNGYELRRIFNISAPNIKSIFSQEEWEIIMSEIYLSEFWKRDKHNWNYPVYFPKAFAKVGLQLKDIHNDFESKEVKSKVLVPGTLKYWMHHTTLYGYLKYIKQKTRDNKYKDQLNFRDELFIDSNENLFGGQKLLFRYRGSGIEDIAPEIRSSFIFPNITDSKNKELMELICSCESVAIHIRRSDMLAVNEYCYKNGYFKRSVNFIRKHTSNPVFIVFCDPESVKWALENYRILGLFPSKDKVIYVDWNKGNDSFRDMQLMSACKHQIITNSSFGWWATWLNTNKSKITCCPDYRFNTTHTF